MSQKNTAFRIGKGLALFCAKLGFKTGIWPIVFYYILALIIIGVWYLMEGEVSMLMLGLLLIVLPIALAINKPQVWVRVPTLQDMVKWTKPDDENQ